jgi:hypothetical protein
LCSAHPQIAIAFPLTSDGTTTSPISLRLWLLTSNKIFLSHAPSRSAKLGVTAPSSSLLDVVVNTGPPFCLPQRHFKVAVGTVDYRNGQRPS